MFGNLSDRLSATFKGLRGKGRLSEADVDATVREIRIALLEADVALPVVREFCATVKARALEVSSAGGLNPAQQVVKIVHEELVAILGGETRTIRFAKNPPTVILLAGLQGAGKTTLAGKLAVQLKREGHTPLLVAADLQRPNAVDQLKVIGERAGVPVFAPEPGSGVGDPVKVTRDARTFAAQKLHDVVIVDTAGRLAIDAELMEQLRQVKQAAQPDEVLFVVDAMIGQDAVRVAEEFMSSVGFDGVVLTKLDGDARGGAALSVKNVTGAPIMFASTGEKLEDFEVFHPERMASRILDMGDVLTLIEHAERAFDSEQTERLAAKVAKGESFSLDDFLEQMQAVKKMGSLGKVLGMLPGMGEMKAQLDQIDDKDLDRVAAIIQSMTPAERQDPKLLNGSRRARIAKGSGTAVQEVNSLMERFAQAQIMMKQMGKGGMPVMPGMPGFGMGGGKKSKGKMPKQQKAAKGAQGRSGNPAKRILGDQQQGASQEIAPPNLGSLPPDLKKMLGQ
ncbi:MAG: signal recognition particle protein [Actinobacteria bacterium]|uniref:signal-recognition-particle GTPase n=1 Tax=freshwater metagenome TaxID=449393 RepID=A0A6J7FM19_9ZZZZ|nr:signal recognition particle protein [Actinomycetota bacterium]